MSRFIHSDGRSRRIIFDLKKRVVKQSEACPHLCVFSESSNAGAAIVTPGLKGVTFSGEKLFLRSCHTRKP